MKKIRLLLMGVLQLLWGAAAASAAELLPGPVRAKVEAVIDGDTLDVRAQIWLDQEIRTLVRLQGIDAPELRGKCETEKQQAAAAKAWLVAQLSTSRGAEVLLLDISYEKYAGRVLATVHLPSGQDLADALLAEGLVRAYDGGRRLGWCG